MSGSIPVISGFIPGDIVISVVGDDNDSGNYGDNQAAPIALEEIDPSTGAIVGELVLSQTTTMNSAGVTEYAISGEYGSSSEGTLELAGNGESLVIAGYGINAATYNAGGAAVYGNAALAQTTSYQGGQYTPVARVIADISYNGTVDTSTALFNVFNTNNPRSVATLNGSSFYISGQGDKMTPDQGVFETNDGSGTSTQLLGTSDTRTVEIYNGDTYVSFDSKTVGGGGIDNLTTGAALPGIGPSVTLNGSNGNALNGSSGSVYLSPENFFFANATTLYIADGGQPKEGGIGDGGLQKWSFSGGTWSLDYTLTAGLNLVENNTADPADTDGSAGLIGMTAVDNSDGTVTFYVTNSTIADLDQTYLYTIQDTLADTTASQASGESFTVLETAAADTNIRGVAFAPTDTTPVSTTTIGAGVTSSGVTVTSGSTLIVASGGVISASTILSAGTAYISGSDSGTYVAEGGQELVSGSASYDSVYGEQIIANGGLATSESVFSNGLVGIASGGTASGMTVNSGGSVVLSGGGTVSGLTIDGGTVVVDTSADSVGGSIVFSSGGEIVLSAGGLAAGTVISGFAVGDSIDLANIGSGAMLTSGFAGGLTTVTVTSGATSESFTFAGNYASGYFELTGDPVLTVNPNVAETEIIISAGVTSSGLSITSGQTLLVESGGTAVSTTIAYGGSAVVSGVDSNTVVQSGGAVSVIGSEVSAVVLSGGMVSVTGSTASAVISAGGSAVISGTDSASAILGGGTEVVYGSATGDSVYGIQSVSGFAASETVYSGGAINVITTGAVASALTIQSGGTLFLSKNVTVSDVTLSGGGSIVTDSPKTVLSGVLDFVGSATLKVEDANDAGYGDLAVISGFGAGDAVDLTFIAPGPTPTLTSAVVGGNTDITVSGGSVSQTFIFAGTGAQFGLTPDGTGGVEIVSGAGTIFPPANYVVSSGQTSSGLVISSGFNLNVLSGGTAVSATVLAGGTAVISGTDSGSTIAAGATETVVSGVVIGDRILGTQNAGTSGGAIGNETVLSGGVVNVTIKGVTVSGITIGSGGSMTLNGNINASNTVLSGGTLALESAKANFGGSLTFLGSGGTIDYTTNVSATSAGYGDQAVINGFVQGDVIDLAFLTSNGSVTSAVTSSGGNTIVTVTSGSAHEAFTFAGAYSSGFFALGKDANGDVELTATSDTPCFAAGTRLLGMEGEMLVEDVKPGDVLVTVRDGGPLCQEVIWTGARSVNLARHPDPKAVRPVRIIAGAFEPGRPERDLRLSPDHAVYIDGCLFTAASLVNGVTIYQEMDVARVTYHHVELASHDVVLAEGLAVESFLDTGNRDMFASTAGPVVLHPDFAAKADAGFCAPMVREGEKLTQAQARLATRAEPLRRKRA